MAIIGHFINGQLTTPQERTQNVYNPATGEIANSVLLASKQTLDQAITSAQAAFPGWRNTPVIKRARIMFK
ncbi:MAG: aldehyde dehydrogenase family protein, partial [Paraglaciecola sp.]|nr:aldehyde dehydrogenase family protein [Paraglaciecola sp.]